MVVADINGPAADSAAAEIETTGSVALSCKVDVSCVESVAKLTESTLRRFDRIDILVNNAVIYPICSVMEMQQELWDHVMETNLGEIFSVREPSFLICVRLKRGGSSPSRRLSLIKEPHTGPTTRHRKLESSDWSRRARASWLKRVLQ